MTKPENKTACIAVLPENKKQSANSREAGMIRILVADDHTVVRDGLVALITQEADMTVVADTGDGQEAVTLWREHKPDITLMDLRMPGLDGVNTIYNIRAAKLIAAALSISEVTVKSHVQSVFRKLNVLS